MDLKVVEFVLEDLKREYVEKVKVYVLIITIDKVYFFLFFFGLEY